MSRLGLQGYAGQSSLMLQGSHAQHDTQVGDVLRLSRSLLRIQARAATHFVRCWLLLRHAIAEC